MLTEGMPGGPGATPRLSRRRVLKSGLMAAAAPLLPLGLVPDLFDPSPGPTRRWPRFETPLEVPEYRRGANVRLTAREADVQILPGNATRMWTFDGSFPGPIIRRPAGHRTLLTVHHELPEDVGTLTIHNHGNHSTPENDGQPGNRVIAPGGYRTYEYELMEDGAPERAAFQWYHDHTHFRTGRNMWMGMVGGFIIEDDLERSLRLPRGEFDLPLIITDRRFDEDNQLEVAFAAPDRPNATPADALGTGYPPFDEAAGIGGAVLVNGIPEPVHEVAATRYRIRVLNASNFLPYNLTFANGMPFLQIATESGLLEEAIPRTHLLIGPAERAEFIVDFTGRTGEEIVLESVHLEPDFQPYTAPGVAPLMQFRVGKPHRRRMWSLPRTLRPKPYWVQELTEQVDRIWSFGFGTDTQGRMAWTVNGRTFDQNRMDARVERGSTETWMLLNTTPFPISHYIHLHLVDWQLLSRNGLFPREEGYGHDPAESGLKETFRIDPGEVIVIGTKFTDHLGPYMIHCHMLAHEDHGMMTNWEVVPEGGATPPEDPFSELTWIEQLRARTVIDEAQRTGRPASRATLENLPVPKLEADDFVCWL